MPPAKLETATPRLAMHSAGDHHSFNYENVAVSYQHFYGKSHTHTQFFSLIAPNIPEPATYGGADEPAFAIRQSKNIK